MTDNAPQTLWVVVDKDGRWYRDFGSVPMEVLDQTYPQNAPHRVVAYVPQGASVPREPTRAMSMAGREALTKAKGYPIDTADDIWQAMYDAAPSPATGDKP